MDPTSDFACLSAKQATQNKDPIINNLSTYLATETHRFITLLNARDFDTLQNEWSHVIDETRFTGTVTNHAPTMSWKDHIDTYRHGAILEPGLQLRITDLITDVDVEAGAAEQYVFTEGTGLSGGSLRTQGVSVLSWRQKGGKGGKWLCIRHTIIKQGMGSDTR